MNLCLKFYTFFRIHKAPEYGSGSTTMISSTLLKILRCIKSNWNNIKKNKKVPGLTPQWTPLHVQAHLGRRSATFYHQQVFPRVWALTRIYENKNIEWCINILRWKKQNRGQTYRNRYRKTLFQKNVLRYWGKFIFEKYTI